MANTSKSKRSVLQLALNLLSGRNSWTKDAAARDRGGAGVEADHKAARSWCLTGAVDAACHRLHASAGTKHAAKSAILRMVNTKHPELEAEEFNDAEETTKRQVLAVLRKAIATVSTVALIAIVSGCATLPSGQQAPSDANVDAQVNSLRSLTKADVTRGRDIFMAASDTDGVLCSNALLNEIPEGGTVGDALKPIGVWSTYAEGRTLHRRLRGFHVSEAVHRACSPLLVDAESLLVRLGALFGGGGILLPGLR